VLKVNKSKCRVLASRDKRHVAGGLSSKGTDMESASVLVFQHLGVCSRKGSLHWAHGRFIGVRGSFEKHWGRIVMVEKLCLCAEGAAVVCRTKGGVFGWQNGSGNLWRSRVSDAGVGCKKKRSAPSPLGLTPALCDGGGCGLCLDALPVRVLTMGPTS